MIDFCNDSSISNTSSTPVHQTKQTQTKRNFYVVASTPLQPRSLITYLWTLSILYRFTADEYSNLNITLTRQTIQGAYNKRLTFYIFNRSDVLTIANVKPSINYT